MRWWPGRVYFLTFLNPSRDNRTLALTARSTSYATVTQANLDARRLFRFCRRSRAAEAGRGKTDRLADPAGQLYLAPVYLAPAWRSGTGPLSLSLLDRT